MEVSHREKLLEARIEHLEQMLEDIRAERVLLVDRIAAWRRRVDALEVVCETHNRTMLDMWREMK